MITLMSICLINVLITCLMVTCSWALLCTVALLVLCLGTIQSVLSCFVIGVPIAWCGFYCMVSMITCTTVVEILALPITYPLAPLCLVCPDATGLVASGFMAGLLPCCCVFLSDAVALVLGIVFFIDGFIFQPISGIISFPVRCMLCSLLPCTIVATCGVASAFLCPMIGTLGTERAAERYREVVHPAVAGGV